MDPDAALKAVLPLLEPGMEGRLAENEVVVLCESVGALDEWLSHGGFLPARWQPAHASQNVEGIVERAFSDANEAAMIGMWTPEWQALPIREVRARMFDLILRSIALAGLDYVVALMARRPQL